MVRVTLFYNLNADQLTPCTYSTPIFHLRHHCRINGLLIVMDSFRWEVVQYVWLSSW